MNEFAQIAASLPDPFRILWRERVTSTNDALLELAEKGTPEGLVLVTDEQTAGRGRRGAQWLSPKGENLAFSVLLRPREPKALWHRLALISGLAVAVTLEKFVPLAEIKGPNDVMVDEKKIAGVLVEAGADFVIVGIGVNINSTDFPDELAATSLWQCLGQEMSRSEILEGIVTRLSRFSESMGSGFEELLQQIQQRCYLTGQEVSYLSAEQRREGLVKGIGRSGELLVESGGKTEALFQIDEIRRLKPTS